MTEAAAPPRIAALRFQPLGKLYHFDASAIGRPAPRRSRHGRPPAAGARWARWSVSSRSPTTPAEGGWKQIERRATAAELVAAPAVAAARAGGDDRVPGPGGRGRPAQPQDRQGRVLLRRLAAGLPVRHRSGREARPEGPAQATAAHLQAHRGRAAPGRAAGRGQDPGRDGRLRAGGALLLALPDRVQPDLDQDGQGAGHLAQSAGDHRHVRPPALLPGVRVRAVRRGAQDASQAQQARDHADGRRQGARRRAAQAGGHRAARRRAAGGVPQARDPTVRRAQGPGGQGRWRRAASTPAASAPAAGKRTR